MTRGIAFASVMTAIISILIVIIGSDITVEEGEEFNVGDLGEAIYDKLGKVPQVSKVCVGRQGGEDTIRRVPQTYPPPPPHTNTHVQLAPPTHTHAGANAEDLSSHSLTHACPHLSAFYFRGCVCRCYFALVCMQRPTRLVSPVR
jgi:hypothetical protein